MAWNPLSAWPNERRWIWPTIAGWVLLLRGPGFVEAVQAGSLANFIPDFFSGICVGKKLVRQPSDLRRSS